MRAPLPQTLDILLIGGGHAHALLLRKWGMAPLAGARLTVVNTGPVAPYTGMLPGAIAGHYTKRDLMIDLVRLGRFAGASVILDRVTGLDPQTRRATLGSGRVLAYDLASIDIGIASDLPEIAGYAEHGVSAKPLGAYADRWEAFVAKAPPSPRVTIIGGGVGGVELALASTHRLRQAGLTPQVSVLERGTTPLAGIAAATRATLLAAMKAQGIALRTGTSVTRISADWVELTDGSTLASDFTLSVAGARPQPWLTETGLELHEGFITVSPTLQSSDPRIFAAGDCAHLAHAPRPKAGVFAVREAPVLFHNLRAAAIGKGTMRRYNPQRDYLKLISMGGQTAVADKFGLRSGGPWLWRLKDRIDRKFMAKFEEFPAMPMPPLPAEHAAGLAEALGAKPMCGGCGAKVGPGALSAALSALPPPRRDDLLSGPGDDAAVLQVSGARQVLTTDHLRAFVSDPALMARLAAVHALGDVWSMGAEPQVALAQITLPRLSERLQARMLTEVMGAAAAVFQAAGADIAGGHSTVGDELTLGFTVTGLVRLPIAKTGAVPGDVIVLTKPLGTGVILAAEMAMARLNDPSLMLGEAWAGCIASMSRPLGAASAALRGRATAMTDVTGFGLAGHLWEMLGKGRMSAQLSLDAVPVLPGGLDLVAQGVASTLMPANRAALDWHIEGDSASHRAALLFDPQTCGGLLATLPPAFAEESLAKLRAAGGEAWVIGRVEAASPEGGTIRLT